MRKLPIPQASSMDTLSLCKSGVEVANLRDRIDAGMDELARIAASYDVKAKGGQLYTIEALPKKTKESAVVAADLTKKEFINLYEYYLRDTKKPGRSVYDALFLSADEKCPFCGGIGRPRNLDHFMPKAFFPQFSIIPVNLVPACRDCNMDGKGQGFPTEANKQIIHPYFDDQCFFEEQWVFGRVASLDPCAIEYFVQAPGHWSNVNKDRAETHFHDFDLAKRYSIQAAEELSTIISQRKIFMRQLSASEFKSHLCSFLDAPLFLNHWKRVMYQTLSNDGAFCSYSF